MWNNWLGPAEKNTSSQWTSWRLDHRVPLSSGRFGNMVHCYSALATLNLEPSAFQYIMYIQSNITYSDWTPYENIKTKHQTIRKNTHRRSFLHWYYESFYTMSTNNPKTRTNQWIASWWFQPISKQRFVRLDHFPQVGMNNKKYLEPPTSFVESHIV